MADTKSMWSMIYALAGILCLGTDMYSDSALLMIKNVVPILFFVFVVIYCWVGSADKASKASTSGAKLMSVPCWGVSVAAMAAVCSYHVGHWLEVPDWFVVCNWQLAMSLHLVGSICLYVAYRDRQTSGAWIPLAITACVLPFVTTDRIPFFFQSLGCPPPIYYMMSVLMVIQALLLWQCGVMTIADGVNTGCTPASGGTNDVIITQEWLPLVCALSSIAYLTICGFMYNLHHIHSTDVSYHLIWSYLRPCYVALFFVYFLKREAPFDELQGILAAFGMIYFGVLAPRADTLQIHKFDYVCVDGQLKPLTDVFKAYEDNPRGVRFHMMEGTCFYLSMLLFLTQGVSKGTWRYNHVNIELTTIVVMCISMLAMAIGRYVWPFENLTVLWVIQYAGGYFTIAVVCAKCIWQYEVSTYLSLSMEHGDLTSTKQK